MKRYATVCNKYYDMVSRDSIARETQKAANQSTAAVLDNIYGQHDARALKWQWQVLVRIPWCLLHRKGEFAVSMSRTQRSLEMSDDMSYHMSLSLIQLAVATRAHNRRTAMALKRYLQKAIASADIACSTEGRPLKLPLTQTDWCFYFSIMT